MTINVLDHGFVRLDGQLADDLSVINSARVSFNKKHYKIETGDPQLINFLMENRHGTPFESNIFRFHIKAPIFVFREWQRHRISSYNEWSARYSELKPEFYIPLVQNVRTQVGKPGHYVYETIDKNKAELFTTNLMESSFKAFDSYKQAIDAGVAKEQARFFLPVNIYSEMYWTVNARSMMNFLSLRNHDKAMWEIKQYAVIIEDIFGQHMPITHASFISNGRVAP